MILDGHYTYASDVWAFGILAWELYASFTTGNDKCDLSVPFCGLENREVNSRTALNAFRTVFLFFFVKKVGIGIHQLLLSSPFEPLSIAAFIARLSLGSFRNGLNSNDGHKA